MVGIWIFLEYRLRPLQNEDFIRAKSAVLNPPGGSSHPGDTVRMIHPTAPNAPPMLQSAIPNLGRKSQFLVKCICQFCSDGGGCHSVRGMMQVCGPLSYAVWQDNGKYHPLSAGTLSGVSHRALALKYCSISAIQTPAPERGSGNRQRSTLRASDLTSLKNAKNCDSSVGGGFCGPIMDAFMGQNNDFTKGKTNNSTSSGRVLE